jgi:hypothetical protein
MLYENESSKANITALINDSANDYFMHSIEITPLKKMIMS